MKRILAAIILVAVVVLAGTQASAQTVNDFVVNGFHGRYELFNDTPGGRMLVTETIDLTFSAQNHGILRAIPKSYQGKSLSLKVLDVERDGQDEPYTTYDSNGNEVLKIGNASKTITGKHTYKISYEMTNIVRFYDSHDEFYWDINGDQWEQPFQKVTAEIILPDNNPTAVEIPGPQCFAGQFGSSGKACKIEPTENGYSFETTQPLGSNQTLTVLTSSTLGTFTPRTWQDWTKENLFQLAGLLAGMVGAIYTISIWWRYGRDYRGRGTIIPEYEPPKGLSPAQVGLLYDYRLDGHDLTATIIDLAVRGYLKIQEQNKTTLGIFKSRSFKLERATKEASGLKPHEQKLLKTIFTSQAAGALVDVKKLNKQRMYNSLQSMRKTILKKLTEEFGLIEKAPKKQYLLLGLIIGTMVFSLFILPLGWGWVIGRLLVVVAAVAVLPFMQRRSHAGVEAFEKIKGLRLYLNTVEKDRLAKLQSVDSPYAAPAPTKQLFEKLLPFAVALGVEKSWAKQFSNIYDQPPDWYSGNSRTFSMAYFASSLSQTTSALNSSFSPPSSSSSSGFSGGGGSSGGGGGGGGGVGW